MQQILVCDVSDVYSDLHPNPTLLSSNVALDAADTMD